MLTLVEDEFGNKKFHIMKLIRIRNISIIKKTFLDFGLAYQMIGRKFHIHMRRFYHFSSWILWPNTYIVCYLYLMVPIMCFISIYVELFPVTNIAVLARNLSETHEKKKHTLVEKLTKLGMLNTVICASSILLPWIFPQNRGRILSGVFYTLMMDNIYLA